MIKVVIDTNVLIDAWRDDFSYTRKIINEVLQGNIKAIASHKIWREHQVILDRLVNDAEHLALANEFFSAIEIVEPKIKVNIVKYDKDDNKFFEAAITGKVNYIISNDSHLWEIGEYKKIKVLKPADFWAEYKKKNDTNGSYEWQNWVGGLLGK